MLEFDGAVKRFGPLVALNGCTFGARPRAFRISVLVMIVAVAGSAIGRGQGGHQ